MNICIVCDVQFETTHKAIKTCSESCSSINAQRLHKERRIKTAKTRSEKLLSSGVENVDYVIDKWNGYATKRMYGIWFKNMHTGRTLQEYKREFPGAPLACETDKKETSKSSGLHMKEEKYRKLQSKKFKGEGNPNHTSRTTLEERQMKSPFSTKFVKYQDKEDKEKVVSEFAKKALQNRVTETNFDYWIKKTNSIEEAEKLYKERQRTFTLEKCINKHGEERGTFVWKERQKKWLKSLYENFTKNGDGRSPSSKFSNDLIDSIVKTLQIEKAKKEKWIKNKITQKAYSYDFCYKNKLIEFNGDYWHCNPMIYESTYINPTKNISAQELWDYDKEKINTANQYGYQVLTVWESDYNKDPQGTIQKCINFLKED